LDPFLFSEIYGLKKKRKAVCLAPARIADSAQKLDAALIIILYKER
jgi:hypothetical protein